VTFSGEHRLTDMNNTTQSRDRASLWIVLAAGLLLILVAAASHASEYPSSTHRTDRFDAAPGIASLSVQNIGGDIRVTAGPAFSATVEISVHAETPALAKKYLDQTRIELRNDGGGAFSLVTEEPGARVTRREGHHWNIQVDRKDCQYRIDAQYTITLPADAAVDVHTVNGVVAITGIAGNVEASSVNGRVRIAGSRHDLRAHSVNGSIEATVADAPKGARLEAETVNGNIQLELPARAGFSFRGHTMNGDIVTTFPLPPLETAVADADRMKAERDRMRAERERIRREIRVKEKETDKRRDESGSDIEIDLSGLHEGLEELSRELERIGPEIAAEVAGSLNHTYEGVVAGGGADVRCTTLNGKIAVLAAGSAIGEAKSLVPRRRGHGIRVSAAEPPEPPEAPVAPSPRPPAVPRTPRPPRPPRAAPEPDLPEGSIIRGDIDGDFSTTLPFGDVQLGKVAGAVRIVTYGGEIKVADAGKGADLSTSGGDIRIDGVRGDLRAVTHGGEVRVGNVSGDAKLETMGGDVDLKSCGGSVIAKTGGGDIRLHRVRGSVRASSGGGSVSCDIVGRETPEGVTISSGAGDVTLVLPANYKANLDIQVNGVDEESEGIVSEFREITVSRRSHSERETATGALNGGGPRVAVRISSGTVHIKKGPPV